MPDARFSGLPAWVVALLLLPCGMAWAQLKTAPPHWGAATPMPLQPALVPPPSPNSLAASAAARQQPAQATGVSVLPEELQSPQAQLQHLQRRVLALEARLAAAEKALATHRHAYQGVIVNQYNYRTLRSLLENSDRSDGTLNWPSLPRTMQTGPAQADAP